MNLLKTLLPLALLLVLFTACEKENSVTNSEVELPELVEFTESNPLITRASGDGYGIELGCFTILYPFGLVEEDGSETTFESDEDFETLSEEVIYVDFAYPLTVTMDDEESTINDGEELGNLFASCVPTGGWEEGDFPAYVITYDNSCYTLNYPIQLINVEEEISTIESEEELIDALSQDLYYFVYPFDLTHEDGEVITVNNMDEIFEALIECNGFNGDTEVDWEQDFEYIGCYLFSFPFDVVLPDGEVVTVNNHMEFCDLMLTGDVFDFAYPISFTDLEGNEVTANSGDELEALLADCNDWNGEGEGEGEFDQDHFLIWIGAVSTDLGGLACYTIEYPISFTQTDDESVLTINSLEDYNDVFFGEYPNLGSYVGNYPMTMTYNNSGESITINTSEEIELLLLGCE